MVYYSKISGLVLGYFGTIFPKKIQSETWTHPPTSIVISDFWGENSLQSPLPDPCHSCPGTNSAAFTHCSGFLTAGVLSSSPRPLSDDWLFFVRVTIRLPWDAGSSFGRTTGFTPLTGGVFVFAVTLAGCFTLSGCLTLSGCFTLSCLGMPPLAEGDGDGTLALPLARSGFFGRVWSYLDNRQTSSYRMVCCGGRILAAISTFCQAAMMWNEHAEKEKIKLQFLKR